MQTPIRQKQQNLRIPYFRPTKCRPCIMPTGVYTSLRPPFPPPLETRIETTVLRPGLVSVLYIHTPPLFQVELEKDGWDGGHALVSEWPEHCTIRMITMHARPRRTRTNIMAMGKSWQYFYALKYISNRSFAQLFRYNIGFPEQQDNWTKN